MPDASKMQEVDSLKVVPDKRLSTAWGRTSTSGDDVEIGNKQSAAGGQLSRWGLAQETPEVKGFKRQPDGPANSPIAPRAGTSIPRKRREVEPSSASWWISQSANLPADRRNGWVVSWIFESFQKEALVAAACEKEAFNIRMRAEGLGSLLESTAGPRAKCKVIQQASALKEQLLDEQGQRTMLQAIGKSLPTYTSGIRCWAAFCEGMGLRTHFPAQVKTVIQWSGLFTCAARCSQCVKHLAFAHRFLRMECTWLTNSVRQVRRGALKFLGGVIRKRPAVNSRQVRATIQAAAQDEAVESACLMAVARLFLLRAPSEGIRLQWNGSHSKIELEGSKITLTLMARKNRATPTVMTRESCCRSSGKSPCAVHWLASQFRRCGTRERVFQLSKHQFARDVKLYGEKAGITGWQTLGTHAFRRGMAQEILDEGGNLAILLKAGDWTSSAFLHYLREAQVQDVAVGQTIINLSESKSESA